MNAAPLPPAIKGWCPSVLHPMETGDGLLVRLHLTGGELAGETCAAIAGLAETYGNGLIDLSQRGNLQLRGVSKETLGALTAALQNLGLAGSSARGEAHRNVIGPPLAGIDPTARSDGRDLVRALEARLIMAADMQNLPDKFCFLVDDGGRLGLDAVAADIRLMCADDCIVLAIDAGDSGFIRVAAADPSRAVETAIALARAFLTLYEGTGARRMGPLVKRIGAETIVRAAGLPANVSFPAHGIRIAEMEDIIGQHDGFIGIAGAFGRFDAKQMRVLASLASEGLRLTPWRCSLLLKGKAQALEVLADAGLIVSPRDPRLAVAACSGQPACNAAQIDTRRAAQELAPIARLLSPKGITLHISGCNKGCAHAAPASVTLVGRGGACDLILDGKADAEPALRGLELSQVLTAMEEMQGLETGV